MKTHKDGTLPHGQPNTVFVYGSNLRGIHGAGAALAAHTHFGAKLGIGSAVLVGRSFGIPTKYNPTMNQRDRIPLFSISAAIKQLADTMRDNPNLTFFLTRVGCGLAGYRDGDVAPLFAEQLEGLYDQLDVPETWAPYFKERARASYGS